jgi:hypothetical protein
MGTVSSVFEKLPDDIFVRSLAAKRVNVNLFRILLLKIKTNNNKKYKFKNLQQSSSHQVKFNKNQLLDLQFLNLKFQLFNLQNLLSLIPSIFSICDESFNINNNIIVLQFYFILYDYVSIFDCSFNSVKYFPLVW